MATSTGTCIGPGLDCEQPDIFDASGSYLHCSMHSIHYDPETGDCLSEICAGKKLAGFRVEERDGMIYRRDKKTKLVANEPD